MRKVISIKKRLAIFTILLAALSTGLAVECNTRFPSRIHIFEGETLDTRSSSPYTLGVPAAFGGILEDNGTVGTVEQTVPRTAEKTGSYNADVKLFGIIPVRSIHVDVHPQTELIPCGSTIGIKIFTQGLVCVGTSELKAEDGSISNPGNDYGIHDGDILLSAGEIPLETTEQLAEIVSVSEGKPLQLTIERSGKTFQKELPPVKTEDGYKLGLWVRDSTAGIGTLTFYDEKTGQFGALGHPISDADTGTLMPVSRGTILNASVFNIKKGARGEPGELKGIFQNSAGELGSIQKNTKQGIYGNLDPSRLKTEGQSYTAASRSQIKEGKASILSNIDGETVQEFEIEIQRVMKYGSENCKDMVIKITDEGLLEKTGGIVQGMSGSPIIQDGKLVGAVTHVFVNDPTRGYGIFIDNMVANLNAAAE